MAKAYINNFGTVSALRVTTSRGTPVAYFTLKNGATFSRDVVVYGAKLVDMMKEIGNGRTAWVRGEVVEMQRKNAKGGSYAEPVLKGIRLKDITKDETAKAASGADATADAGAEESAAASAEADAAAEAAVSEEVADETRDLNEEIPF